jgi:gliding motility-associated-like protein
MTIACPKIMRNSLFLAICLLLSQLNVLKAQVSMFSLPDTVCIRQPVRIIDSLEHETSYYWGFCSGFTFNAPVGYNPGVAFAEPPTAFEIVRDGDNYYGFAAIGGFGAGPDKLIMLSFGNSLNSTPDTVDYGTLTNTMPVNTRKFRFFKDGDEWYAFLCGGLDSLTSSIARLDFGTSLGNTPNSVNFGNLDGVLRCPSGIFIEKEGSSYYGYVANACDDKLLMLDFGSNISLTPAVTDLGDIFGFSGPTDMAFVLENGDWFAFVANRTSSTVTRLYFGNSLTNLAFATNIGSFGNRLFNPVGISYFRDCDYMHLFITNYTTNDIARIDMTDILGPYSNAANYVGIGSINYPTGMSTFIREKDTIKTYIPNWGSNSLSEIIYPQCSNASIKSATTKRPPVYSYDTPGTYNVYLAVNEGRHDMKVECKQIVVLPIPNLSFTNDTLICQGDTVTIFSQSVTALSYAWYPNYNISDTGDVMTVQVWPEFSTDYHLVLPYANGCIVDTAIRITVSKVKADAGPDRTISDGAKTMLGSPHTIETKDMVFHWMPDQFISSTSATNPVANPPYDFTYYLEVKNSLGCYDIDTVVVRVVCDDINMPNAFAPESPNAVVRHFGLMNKNIVKLNYFRVYDRWGKEVFNTTDVMKGWDGTINGNPAPMGVYVWEADGFCVGGQHFKRSGNVTLLR